MIVNFIAFPFPQKGGAKTQRFALDPNDITYSVNHDSNSSTVQNPAALLKNLLADTACL